MKFMYDWSYGDFIMVIAFGIFFGVLMIVFLLGWGYLVYKVFLYFFEMLYEKVRDKKIEKAVNVYINHLNKTHSNKN